MKKYITVLVIAALVQLALIAMTWVGGGSSLDTRATGTALLAFNRSEVDHIVIKGGTNEIILDKQGGTWLTEDGFPADQNKVQVLLKKLAGLQTGFPVATSSAALSRFKVAGDQYERLIELKKGNELVGKLYLGTGAGARQSHVRSGEQNAVYTVAMATYDVPVKVEDWQDKTLLRVDEKHVTGVQLGDLLIQPKPFSPEKDKTKAGRSPAGKEPALVWKIRSPANNQKLNQKAVNQGLDKLFSLDYVAFLGKEDKPEYGLDKAELKLTLTLKNGKRVYRFARLKDSSDYVLHVSDRDEYFKVASYVAKPVIESITPDKWEVASSPAVSQVPPVPVSMPGDTKSQKEETKVQ